MNCNPINIFNLNQFLGEIYHAADRAMPNQEDVDASCSYHRQNDLKCLAAGGCTFVGALLPLIGGWFWIISGAACGACGNLASYRFSRTTQKHLDLEANVKWLVEKDPQNEKLLKDLLARISKLEEENEKNKTIIAEADNNLCINCLKSKKVHCIETPVLQLQTIGKNIQ